MTGRAVLIALIVLLAPARASAAIVCSPEADGFPPFVLGDVDDDNAPDVAVGLPQADQVVVRQTGHAPVTLAGAAGTRFGAAVAIGDVDADGCADVLVGAPAADTVFVYRGSPAGLATSPSQVDGAPGDGFGAAVVIAVGPDASGADVWIGAPGRAGAAGAVDHYVANTSATFTLVASITAATPAPGEHYGSVLGPVAGGVYVGVPRRRARRGAVEHVRSGGARTVSTLAHARPGDRFGAALTTSFATVAGAPGRFRGRGSVLDLAHHREITQDSPGVPGHAARGHRFGTAVIGGRAFTCQEDGSFAVGAPGEDSVTLVSGAEHCPKRIVRAGIGGALGLRRFRDDFDEDTYDTLLVGVPSAGRVRLRQADTAGSSFGLPATGRQVFAVVQSGSALG